VTDRPIDRCSAPYRVRFDEAGPDGLLRTSVLLRYAQDLAWYHAAQSGFDRAWYAQRGLGWLVRAAEVAVLAQVRVGDELVGTTWAVGQRRVWARRRTEFSRADGTLVGWTHIDWLLLDARGAPTRIPPEFDTAFGTPPTTIGLARVDLGVAPPDAPTLHLRVRPQELDPMAHANNAVCRPATRRSSRPVTRRPCAGCRASPVSSTPAPRNPAPTWRRPPGRPMAAGPIALPTPRAATCYAHGWRPTRTDRPPVCGASPRSTKMERIDRRRSQ
jgi:acyl-CoA thioesterase FadM